MPSSPDNLDSTLATLVERVRSLGDQMHEVKMDLAGLVSRVEMSGDRTRALLEANYVTRVQWEFHLQERAQFVRDHVTRGELARWVISAVGAGIAAAAAGAFAIASAFIGRGGGP